MTKEAIANLTDKELDFEIKHRFLKKKELILEIDNIDTDIVGLKEEKRKRAKL